MLISWNLEHKKNILCFCNNVSEESVLEAIRQGGAKTLSQVYDLCGAGTGPCGGSCRTEIKSLLKQPLHQQLSPQPSEPSSSEKTPWVPPRELSHAISLFNRRYYWETHEVLEHMWLEETGSTKLFYQSLIQAAASFYHVLNANPQGVIKLALEAAKKLSTYLPAYESIPLLELHEALIKFAKQAQNILSGVETGFDYDSLPVLTLGKDMDRSSILR